MVQVPSCLFLLAVWLTVERLHHQLVGVVRILDTFLPKFWKCLFWSHFAAFMMILQAWCPSFRGSALVTCEWWSCVAVAEMRQTKKNLWMMSQTQSISL